jgi:RNA polymerase sigma-70 factor (ECF subfamily)
MGEASWSDAELIGRTRRGDVEAFGRLVERYQDYVYNAAYHLLGGDQEAEDIAQEVFVRAFSHLRGFEGRARFSTWLYGITLNCVRSRWRQERRRATVRLDGSDEDDEGGQDPPADTAGPVEAAMQSERVEAVRSAIACLEPELREAVVLRDIQGLSYEEIAESLGVPLGTVKSRLFRARQALKDLLEPLVRRAR